LTNACFVSGVGSTESGNAGFGVFRSVTCSGPVTLMGNAAFGHPTISGQINGPGSLIVGAGKTGSGVGTMVIGSLNGPNSYVGDTVVGGPTNADYTSGGAHTLQIAARATNINPNG